MLDLDKSLKSEFPHLCEEWNYKKNANVQPNQISPFSNKSVWWIGECGHEWRTAVVVRTKQGSGCPYCAGSKVLEGFNDIFTTDASCKKEWDYDKNVKKPTELTRGSQYKAWWICSEGHSYQATVGEHLAHHRGCPYCSNHKLLKGFNDFLTKYPQLAEEWHPSKNLDLKPSDIMPTRHIKIWWLGKCGHEWEAFPANRIAGKGKCPICLHRTIIQGVNDLATSDPDMAEEWHPSKNGNLRPCDISVGYNKKVWWLGKCGHEWFVAPNSRKDKIKENGRYTGCPVCANKAGHIRYDNSIVVLRPDIMQEWHPLKNAGIDPRKLTPGSSKKVWWIGDCGHEWDATVNSRCLGRSCPYCSGNKILIGFNDLESLFPTLVKEWDFEKNKILPTEVSVGTHKSFWWKCEKHHSFKMSINSRTKRNAGCPHCSANSTSFPEQFIYWSIKSLYPNTQNRVVLDNYEFDIFLAEKKLYVEYSGFYWHKNKEQRSFEKQKLAQSKDGIYIEIIDDHQAKNKYGKSFLIQDNQVILDSGVDFEMSLKKSIDYILKRIGTKNYKLDYEQIKRRAFEYSKGKIEYSKCLEYTHPELAAQWDFENNIGIEPKDITFGSKKKIWWLCDKGHSFQATPNRRTSMGTGCPICSNKMTIPGISDFGAENPSLLDEWNYKQNKGLDPRCFSSGSNKKVWWICEQGHEWEATIKSRKMANCPYCGHRKILKGFNDLATVNPELSEEWNYNRNELKKPFDFMANSHKKVWWICKAGHEWEATIVARNKGAGCPLCKKT